MLEICRQVRGFPHQEVLAGLGTGFQDARAKFEQAARKLPRGEEPRRTARELKLSMPRSLAGVSSTLAAPRFSSIVPRANRLHGIRWRIPTPS
jgi:hypothetical protein